jgi:hypothetical protein
MYKVRLDDSLSIEQPIETNRRSNLFTKLSIKHPTWPL